MVSDSFHIETLFISDRPSAHTMTLESDTLRIVFAESNHSTVNEEWNHIGSILSSGEHMNPIRYGFAQEPLFRKGSLVFGFFNNSLAVWRSFQDT